MLSACSGSGVTVRGDIAQGGGGKTILVERISPNGAKVVDSVKTDRKGSFSVFIEQKGETPEFYTLRLPGGASVPLLAAASEKIVVQIADSAASSYSVKGSEGSAQVLEANRILAASALKLDSLAVIFNQTADTAVQRRIAREYGAAEVARKQVTIGFLMKNAGSLAAIVPLYQSTRGGEFVFGDQPEDVLYFRMVSDSLNSRYPDSPYAKSLAADVQSFDNIAAAGQKMAENMDNVVTFPELNLPDVLGKKQRLSDLKGKVILLSFTASNLPELKILNRELVEVHHKYAKQGFEVYQVSLDMNKAQWIGSVADQRLPWISVCDLQGGNSAAVSLYNVQRIPANFLIDREGNIVRRNLGSAEIGAAVAAAL